MRIAIFLESLHDSGGGFQQALSTVEALTRKGATKHEIQVFTPHEETRLFLRRLGIEAVRFKHSPYRLLDRWSASVFGNAILRRLRRLGLRRLGRHLDALLDDHGIDLALFNECGEYPRRIGDHPLIVTVWDLDHRDHPEFPEAFADRVFERRERDLRVMLNRSAAVIANSVSGADRIADLYQVDRDRILVLPFIPTRGVRRHAAGNGSVTADEVRRKYDLPDRYVFYPAYFSYHKNHLYLLEGLVELERRHGVKLHAVFCGGGDPGDQEVVEAQVDALGLAARVKFLGLVPDEEIPAFYEAAFAMVMPVYFGPTNLPPIEAAALGCPVVYSDIPGCREQMGDAALYCDLADPGSLADHLAALLRDPALVERLKTAGAKLSAELADIDYAKRLEPIFDSFAYVSRRWNWPRKTA